MSDNSSHRGGKTPPPRRAGAALADLLGQRTRQTRRQDYETLAQALADALPLTLAETLARALGVEPSAYVEREPVQETEVDTAPETEPETEPEPEDDLEVRFGLRTVDAERDHAGAKTKPKQEQRHVKPDPALRLRTLEDWIVERDARIKATRSKKFAWTRDPLHHEALIMPDYRGTVVPNFIARAQLYDQIMLYGNPAFKKRFDRAFGIGAANRVLSGQG